MVNEESVQKWMQGDLPLVSEDLAADISHTVLLDSSPMEWLADQWSIERD